VIETISRCPDALKRDFMVRDVAFRFALAEHDLYRELSAALRKRQFERINEAQRGERFSFTSAASKPPATSIQAPSGQVPSENSHIIDERVGQRVGQREERDEQVDEKGEKGEKGEKDAPFAARGGTTQLSASRVPFASDDDEQVNSPVPEAASQHGSTASTTDVTSEFALNEREILPAEREILRVALTQKGAVGYIRERLEITEERFVSASGRYLFALLARAAAHTNGNEEPLQTLLLGAERFQLSDAATNVLSALAVRREVPSAQWRKFDWEPLEDFAKLLRDCALQLHIAQHAKDVERLHNALKHAQHHNEGADREQELLVALSSADGERRRLESLLSGASDAMQEM
jgi:hypothetical protein